MQHMYSAYLYYEYFYTHYFHFPLNKRYSEEEHMKWGNCVCYTYGIIYSKIFPNIFLVIHLM